MTMTYDRIDDTLWLMPPEIPEADEELLAQIEKLERENELLRDAWAPYAVAELCRLWFGWQGSDEDLSKRASEDGDEWLDTIAAAIQAN